MDDEPVARGVVSDVETVSQKEAEEEHEVLGNELEYIDPLEAQNESLSSEDKSNHVAPVPSHPPHVDHSASSILEGAYPQPPYGVSDHNDMPPWPPQPPSIHPMPNQPPPSQHILQFYEAQMRDHAVAYASAAASAAWAAAQIAADMANATISTTQPGASVHNPHIPRSLPVPVPPSAYGGGPPQPLSLGHYGVGPPGPMYAHSPFDPSYPPLHGLSSPMYMPQHAHPPMNFQYTSTEGQGPAMMAMGSEDGSLAHDSYGYRRRKRQQPMPPSEDRNHRMSQQPGGRGAGGGERRGRRRRLRPDGSSDNDSSTANCDHRNPAQQHLQGNNPNNRRPTRIRKIMASSNSSDGGGSAASANYLSKKKKPRQPTDESLLGKTGVSALYEWCGKRRTTPTFTLQEPEIEEPVDAINDPTSSSDDEPCNSNADDEKRRRHVQQKEFEMTVSIDGIEWGQGRARTKSAAKQEAARRALQVLLPGVIFEEASGVLVHLPNGSAPPHHVRASHVHPTASLDDLVPNLAKRLAIGHGDDEDQFKEPKTNLPQSKKSIDHSKKRPSKWRTSNAGTSTTTSEEEDGDTYYASRGASICSDLLHAMVQIDERIPEAPSYAYEIALVSDNSIVDGKDCEGNPQHLKRKAGGPSSSSAFSRTPILVHRGPFTCTSSMRLKRTPGGNEKQPAKAYDLLQAVGVAGTKREARHTASAKLLALLFPYCDGMVKVKEAAEIAREEYAASKALKQHSKRERAFMSKIHRWNRATDQAPNLDFALASKSTAGSKLPDRIEQHILRGLGVGDERGETGANFESSTTRQFSRQKQLDVRIAAALQKLNEHDDEGRSRPDEVTVDDVGRTLLRRVTPEDCHWITKLLDDFKPPLHPVAVISEASTSDGESEASNGMSSIGLRLWSTSTVVLLLCRAIAPYDDPPLGCAVLTLGFSMKEGRTLRLAQIGSKPHLPRERFIECLQSFAVAMGYALEQAASKPEGTTPVISLRQREIHGILKSFLPSAEAIDLIPPLLDPEKGKRIKSRLRDDHLTLTTPLQSVQEEIESIDESGAESSSDKGLAKKEQDKPSKRSRVQ